MQNFVVKNERKMQNFVVTQQKQAGVNYGNIRWHSRLDR